MPADAEKHKKTVSKKNGSVVTGSTAQPKFIFSRGIVSVLPVVCTICLMFYYSEILRDNLLGLLGFDSPEVIATGMRDNTLKKEKPLTSKQNLEIDQTALGNLAIIDQLFVKRDFKAALKGYEIILSAYPNNPRALIGHAKSFDNLAEVQQSNDILLQAINPFQKVVDAPNIPDEIAMEAGIRLAERQSFYGKAGAAIITMRNLIKRFPSNVELIDKLGVNLLIAGKDGDAERVFKKALSLSPNDGYAKVHLGYILKTRYQDYINAVPLLQEGIATRSPGVIDGRFYMQLGDALYRLGRPDESKQVYADGAKEGVFRSAMQRSTYNVDSLSAQPWWTIDETGFAEHFHALQTNWKKILEEGLRLLEVESQSFSPEEENLREKGDWGQFTLFQRGLKNHDNCNHAPITCSIIDQWDDSRLCTRGQVKFSVIHPGTHIWPHVGPTNCRLRSHLGLVIPPQSDLRIRVSDVERTWKEGEFLIFDDSFEHEVWYEKTETTSPNESRLILIVDFWHPELNEQQKRYLSPI